VPPVGVNLLCWTMSLIYSLLTQRMHGEEKAGLCSPMGAGASMGISAEFIP